MTNPADAFASPFGWHDTNGAAGPEFTTTQGNNAHAYSDRDNDNNAGPGSSPERRAALEFDFAADYLADQPQSYTDSTVTNLFYWCNMVHDLTYQYGFNEQAGNFQVNNYGRAAPAVTTSAARRRTARAPTTPTSPRRRTDGGRPRMQMFLWPGLQFGMPSALTVDERRARPAPTAATTRASRPRRPRPG